jgi:hypothetical protein
MTTVNVQSPDLTTRPEAEAWRDQYLARFHPCGYGTTLQIVETCYGVPNNGTTEKRTRFVVTGWRGSSCD